MSSIAQIRSLDIGSSWGEKLTLIPSSIFTNATMGYKDTFLTINNGLFDDSHSYFLDLNINRRADYEQIITIRLLEDIQENSNFIQLEQITIPIATNNETIERVSLCFSPTQKKYKGVVLILSNRMNKDESVGLSSSVGYVLNNLIPASIDNISQVSIQSHPGFKFVIDGEEMEVGKTGIYEMLLDTYKVSNLGVVRNNNDSFIIDYRYERSVVNE